MKKRISLLMMFVMTLCLFSCQTQKEVIPKENSNMVMVNTNSYHGFSAEEAIKGISAVGFKYVELTATQGWTEHVFAIKVLLDFAK